MSKIKNSEKNHQDISPEGSRDRVYSIRQQSATEIRTDKACGVSRNLDERTRRSAMPVPQNNKSVIQPHHAFDSNQNNNPELRYTSQDLKISMLTDRISLLALAMDSNIEELSKSRSHTEIEYLQSFSSEEAQEAEIENLEKQLYAVSRNAGFEISI